MPYPFQFDGIDRPGALPRFVRQVIRVPAGAVSLALSGACQADLLLVNTEYRSGQSIPPLIEAHLSRLHPDGWLLLLGSPLSPALEKDLDSLGLTPYPVRFPRAASRYTLIESHRNFLDPLGGRGFFWVRKEYVPLEHARRLSEAGRADAAFEILDGLPEPYRQDLVQQLLAALEMQMALLSWPSGADGPNLLERFYWAQMRYFAVLNLQPCLPAAHQCQAHFWRMIGDDAMARRLLSSILHSTPDEAAQRQRAAIPVRRAPSPPEEEAPVCRPDFRPRLLLLNHANADCGFDALFDGLCRVLGDGRVVEYPWKHFLHGGALDENIRHPSACNHPGPPQSVDELEAQLRAGQFDAVVFSDILELGEREETLRLVHARPGLPVFFLDTMDEGWDNQPRFLEYLELPEFRGAFKREMLHCARYLPNTHPLPLSYNEDRVRASMEGLRPLDVFWAGQRNFGARRLALDLVERMLKRRFEDFYPQDEYARRLGQTLIGLDVSGLGFDTVRYYELPAHGCMLLAERKPIRIPHDFTDGVSAVFFEDLAGLEEKLRHYLAHPEQARAIAAAGHAHMRLHHTSTARARQFLGWMERAL